MCNVVSGSALPILKSYLVTAVALELLKTLSVFWLAQLLVIFVFARKASSPRRRVNCKQ